MRYPCSDMFLYALLRIFRSKIKMYAMNWEANTKLNYTHHTYTCISKLRIEWMNECSSNNDEQKKHTHTHRQTQQEQNHRTKPWSVQSETEYKTRWRCYSLFELATLEGKGRKRNASSYHYYRYLTIKWLSLAHKRTIIWVRSLRLCVFYFVSLSLSSSSSCCFLYKQYNQLVFVLLCSV